MSLRGLVFVSNIVNNNIKKVNNSVKVCRFDCFCLVTISIKNNTINNDNDDNNNNNSNNNNNNNSYYYYSKTKLNTYKMFLKRRANDLV